MLEKELQQLIPAKNIELFNIYMQYINLLHKHFTNKKIDKQIRFEQISLLERAIRKDFPLKNNIIARLQKMFVAENLSLYLLLDPLIAWRYLANDKIIKTEKQAADVVGYLSSPSARLIMVLNNETPSSYLAMTSLISLLYFRKIFTDKTFIPYAVKWGNKRKSQYLRGLLKNSVVLLQIVNSKSLKFRLALLFNRLRIQIDNEQNNKQLTIGLLDWLKILVYSVFQFVTIRHRTVSKKEI
ncbi:MAG: hypothetical protein IJ525_03985 [Alphaproteobacteria bacterium]|nr:hypothetical protein [Alphaproteobacteria bacterium]